MKIETDLPTQPNPAGAETTVAAATSEIPSSPATRARTPPVQIVLIVLGIIAFLYFARPVILPVALACVAGMTLKPLMRWLSGCHIPPGFAAAIVLCLLVAVTGIGFFQLGRPALA